MTDFVDLHVHTTASDGMLSPEEVVQLAAEYGIRAIAITDHDTVEGVGPAMAAGEEHGVEVIPGVELSIDYTLPDNGHMHLLGLFIDPASPSLCAGLDWLRQQREARTPKIIVILNEQGMDISEDEVKALVKDGVVGRPHIARVMLEKRCVFSIKMAFDNYLKKGAIAYVPRSKFELQKAIDLVRQAGGYAILAHPLSLNLPHPKLEKLVVTLKDMGLAGIEAYHSDHSKKQTAAYLNLAQSHGLLVTGGTDFHGNNKLDVQLGIGHGELKVPYSVVEGFAHVCLPRGS